MRVVILAGGRGTRLAEETGDRPKPMVEIGGKPMLWHIMNIYAAHGFTDFVIACGYRGEIIKEYFRDFFLVNSDYVIDMRDGSVDIVNSKGLDWRVAVVDTGLDTMTGGRLRRLAGWLRGSSFMVTYGDGVADVNIRRLVDFHRAHGKKGTVTAVRPPARFGGLDIEGDTVTEFSEKPQTHEGWINGGFFVFEPGFLDYLDDDQSILERTPLEALARDGHLMAYKHEGFWQPMDTLREKRLLESAWNDGSAPWKVW